METGLRLVRPCRDDAVRFNKFFTCGGPMECLAAVRVSHFEEGDLIVCFRSASDHLPNRLGLSTVLFQFYRTVDWNVRPGVNVRATFRMKWNSFIILLYVRFYFRNVTTTICFSTNNPVLNYQIFVCFSVQTGVVLPSHWFKGVSICRIAIFPFDGICFARNPIFQRRTVRGVRCPICSINVINLGLSK